jgi:hypothetical protein
MADKKPNAAKDFFVKHGEKLGLGIAVLVLLVYVFTGYLGAKEDPNLQKLDRAIKTLDEQSKTPKEKDLPPKEKPWETAAVTPWNTISSVAKGADDWAGSLYSELAEIVKEVPKIKPRPALAPSLEFGKVDVQLDSVTIDWSLREYTAAEKAKGKKDNDYVDVTAFKVERETNGTGKWELLAEIADGKARSYKDVKIEPKSRYTYRVTALSDTKEFKERGGADGTPNPTGLIGTAVSGAPAKTLGIWRFQFQNPFKPENAEKGQVFVTIEKYEKPLATKVEKKRIHKAGDVIGWWEEPGSPEPTSKHRVQVGTKSHEVDFDTKTTLVSVEPKKVTIEIKKCKPVFGPGGVKEKCDTITEKRAFDVFEITLKGPDGDEKFHSPNPRDNPNGQDQFCEDHGGRKAVVGLPPGPKPDMPAEDPAVAAKRKKELDAEKLFKDAEKLLNNAQKAKDAIPMYEKLLTTYGDTDFVAKGQRAVIEDRLNKLREAK